MKPSCAKAHNKDMNKTILVYQKALQHVGMRVPRFYRCKANFNYDNYLNINV